MNARGASLLMLLGAALLLPVPAGSTLWSASNGYDYTGGDGYWAHRLWSAGDLRIAGGWYPYYSFSGSADSGFDWIVAPELGLGRGIPGIGRLRAGYLLYHGSFEDTGEHGATHGLELGWFRVFAPAFYGDLSYRFAAGDLFPRASSVRTTETRLAQTTEHEAGLAAGWMLLSVRSRPTLLAGVTMRRSKDESAWTETLGVSVPLRGGVSIWAGASVLQGKAVPFYSLTSGFALGLAGVR